MSSRGITEGGMYIIRPSKSHNVPLLYICFHIYILTRFFLVVLWSRSSWIFNSHPETAHFFGSVPMSLARPDTLQPISALHQGKTERITRQKPRDWDRVKAILYYRKQHKHSATQTAALFPVKQCSLEGIALTAAHMNLILSPDLPPQITHTHTTVNTYTSDIRGHVRLRAFSHFPSLDGCHGANLLSFEVNRCAEQSIAVTSTIQIFWQYTAVQNTMSIWVYTIIIELWACFVYLLYY